MSDFYWTGKNLLDYLSGLSEDDLSKEVHVSLDRNSYQLTGAVVDEDRVLIGDYTIEESQEEREINY